MSETFADFQEILDKFPALDTMTFKSERDMQDFLERDFDRRLEIYKVRTLVTIAFHLGMQSVSNP